MAAALTQREEANYSMLNQNGHGELAELYRSHRLRDHETFEKLSKADLNAVYGTTISEEWVSAIRKTIASGDHILTRSMHEYLLTLKKKNEEPEVTPERSGSKAEFVSEWNSPVFWWTLSAVLVMIGLFMGSY